MERIWLKNYQPGVPKEIDADAYPSLVTLFEQSCQTYANNIAYYNLGGKLTFQQWHRYSLQMAAFLQKDLQMAKGERFAIMLPNTLQYPIAMMAALSAGLTVVNINPLYTVPELAKQLQDSGATAIICLANFAHILQQALPQTMVKHVIITQLGDLLPFPKSLLTNFVLRYIKKLIPAWSIPNVVAFRHLLSKGKPSEFAPVAITSQDLAFLQYTGGTTGVAKGAMLTHRNMVANVLQATAWIKPAMPAYPAIILAPLPLYHIFSLTANCLTFMTLGAANVLITNPRDIAFLIKTLRQFPVTGMTGVNTLFKALLNHPQFTQLNFSHLKFCLGGGAAIQTAVAETWQKVTGIPLFEAYGLSETSPAVTINPFQAKTYQIGSVGLPVSSTEIRLLNDEGQAVGLDTPGELFVKGPQVMAGYWQNPSETAQVLSTDGWLKTGDIATIDQQGFIHIVDRKKDLIIVSGFKVFPNEVENTIATHPGVLEVAVIGIADEHSGETVKAFIVRKDPNLSEEMVRDYCKQKLTGYKIPHYFEFRDQLPKSNVGKILRRNLRD